MFKPLTMCLGVRPARLDSMQRHREPRRSRQWNLHHLNTKSDPPLGLHLFYCLATPTNTPVSVFWASVRKNQSYKLPIENTVYQVSHRYLKAHTIYQMKNHPETKAKVYSACLQNCSLFRSIYIACLGLSYYHKTLSSK